jgi:hypothetical protein
VKKVFFAKSDEKQKQKQKQCRFPENKVQLLSFDKKGAKMRNRLCCLVAAVLTGLSAGFELRPCDQGPML